MGVLSSCWRFVEFAVIPREGGPRRWLVLSYSVHPVLLVHCRLYMLAKAVAGSVLEVFYYQIRFVRWVVAAPFILMMRTLENLVLIMELDDASIIRKYGIGAPRERWFDFLATEEDDDEDPRRSIVLYNDRRQFPSKAASMSVFDIVSSDEYEEEEEETQEAEEEVKETEEAEEEEEVKEAEEAEEEEEDKEIVEAEWYPVVLSESEENDETGGENRKEQDRETEEEEITLATASDVVDEDTDARSSSQSLSNETIPIWQTRRKSLVIEAEEDEFYKDYIKSMNIFDLINNQAIGGVSMTSGADLGSPAQLETIVRRLHTLTGMSGMDIVGSLVSSIETAYVAQSCLSWEALHHQYRKVVTLESSAGASECAFPRDLAARFQHFHVLLDWFMERDRLQGRRVGNYSWERFSAGLLLQVPGVTGYVVDAGDAPCEERMKGGELLKILEKAITTFHYFLEQDDFNQHRGMKLMKASSVDSRVENPNDLLLLSKLLKDVKKKEVKITNLSKGKRGWWWEKEKEKVLVGMGRSNDLLFAAIDMKLVSRVLNMSNVTTEQLKWCQDKLNAVQVSKAFLVRNYTDFLFPCS